MPEITPLPLLRRTPSGPEQCVRVEFTPDDAQSGDRCGIRVRRRGWELETDLGVLPPEGCVRKIFLPEAADQVPTEFTVTCGESSRLHTLRMGPVRRWIVHVVLHSHTDLGFTHPVSEVARIHNENTDLAVQYCRETADWPEGSRFKWTCEVTWQVQNYLRDRGAEEVENLMRWVRQGSIGVGALHSGLLTGLLGHEEAIRSFAFAGFLRRTYGIPCDTALLCDVPGCTEGFVQVMAKSGIRNLIIADNNFLAPFLPRTDLPRPFLWQGEGGTEVLAWYTDHPYYAYVEGEYYGLLDRVETVEEKLSDKLRSLESEGYPYERYQIQYAFDNARLSERPMEVVKQWNERWAYPRLVLSTAREFLEHLRAQKVGEFPRRRGDWSDWWGGIVAGFPREESLTRRCHTRAPATEFFAQQAALRNPEFSLPAGEMGGVYDRLLSFDEHSGGGALWRPPSREEQDRAVREGYGSLYEAASTLDRLERSAASALARCIDNPGDEGLLAAFNASPFPVSAPVGVPGSSGVALVEDIPPWGYRTVVPGGRECTGPETAWEDVEGGVDAFLEGCGYRIRIDSATGSCTSLFDGELRRELVREGGRCNEVVVYLVHPVKEVELGKYIPEIYDGRPHPGEFLQRPAGTRVRLALSGDRKACRATHIVEGIPWMTQEYRLFEQPRGVQITNILPCRVRDDARLSRALSTYLPRRGLLYLRFAFDVPGGIFEYESTGMIQCPGETQFKGACRDFFPVQKWCRIVGEGHQVILSLPDTPLVDVGTPGLMRFKETLDADQSVLLVRAVDLRDWGGDAESPYSKKEDIVIRFAVGADVEQDGRVRAARFAAQAFPVVLAGVVPGRSRGSLPAGAHSFCDAPHNVEIMTMKPAEDGAGIVLRVRETGGIETTGSIDFPGLTLRGARRAMLTEEPLEEVPILENGILLRLPPFGIETFRMDVEVNRS